MCSNSEIIFSKLDEFSDARESDLFHVKRQSKKYSATSC